MVCCSRCREPRRLPAWIAKGCRPPLARRCAIARQSSAFFCHGAHQSAAADAAGSPDFRGPYRVLTGGGCRRKRQGERSRLNAHIEQAPCAAGFSGEAKREASARKPRWRWRGAARQCYHHAGADRAPRGGRKRTSAELSRCGMTTPSRHKWGGGSRNAKRKAAPKAAFRCRTEKALDGEQSPIGLASTDGGVAESHKA